MAWLAGIVLLSVLTGGCSSAGGSAPPSSPSATPSPTKATKIVYGALDVEGDFVKNTTTGRNTVGGPCAVPVGYDDVHDGGQVAILDSTGTTVALTTLKSTGLRIKPGSTSMADTWCGFTFQALEVPTGKDFYAIVVGHRDPYRLSESDLFSSDLELKLGAVPEH